MSPNPKKLALNYNPPILILQYESSTDSRPRNLKLFLQDFLEKELNGKSSPDRLTQLTHKISGKLYIQYKDYFRKVPSNRLNEMIGKLVTRFMEEGGHANGSSEVAANVDLTSIDQIKQIDLNKLDEDQLEQAKMTMDVDFELNRLRPGDPGYEHDVEEDFGAAVEDSGWDSD